MKLADRGADMNDDTDFIMKVSSSEYSGPSGAGDKAHGPNGIRRDSRVELKVPTITYTTEHGR